jgi:hypothetical protein
MVLVAGSKRNQKDLLFLGGVMKTVKRNRKIWLVLMSLFLLATLPVVTSAQGRGRGRGQEKKLDKFVNGHDARDGRWDGRGPGYGSRTGISNAIWQQRRGDRFRDREFERNWRFRDRRFEFRRRGFNNDDFLRWQRPRHSSDYHYRRGLYRH